MRKRKSRGDQNKARPPPASDLASNVPCTKLSSKQKLAHQVDGSVAKPPLSSITGNTDGSVELSPGHQLSEISELPGPKLETSAPSSLNRDAKYIHLEKKACGICERRLRKRSYNLDNSLSSGDHGVVAVLVCGHLYHADCLEQNTPNDDKSDPLCPVCEGLVSQVSPPLDHD